jgi:hypothetical protein
MTGSDAQGRIASEKPHGEPWGFAKHSLRASDYMRSMIAAIPWPPPMHIVMSP